MITPVLVNGSVWEFKNPPQIIITNNNKTQSIRNWNESNKTYLLVSDPLLVSQQWKPEPADLRPAVSSSHHLLGRASSSSVSGCLYTAGVPRSFIVISRTDAPPQTSTPAVDCPQVSFVWDVMTLRIDRVQL